MKAFDKVFVFLECFKIQNPNGNCWVYQEVNEKIVYGDANCDEFEVFHILNWKLYSGERCVLENSGLTIDNHSLLMLGDCNNSKVINGVEFESSGMLEHENGYFINLHQLTDAENSIILFGHHSVTWIVFQVPKPTSCIRKTLLLYIFT